MLGSTIALRIAEKVDFADPCSPGRRKNSSRRGFVRRNKMLFKIAHRGKRGRVKA